MYKNLKLGSDFQLPLGLKLPSSISANNLYLIGGGETEILEQHGHRFSQSASNFTPADKKWVKAKSRAPH